MPACGCANSMKSLAKHSVSGAVFHVDDHSETGEDQDFPASHPLLGIDRESLMVDKDEMLTEQTHMTVNSSSEEQKHKWKFALLYFCFFLAGIGLSMCWGSISFLVTFWTTTYGDRIWPIFLVAYNVPGFFVLITQLYTDQFCQTYICNNSPKKAYFVRGIFALSLLAICCIGTPILQHFNERALIIALVLVVGISVGCAHGWLFSLGALFPKKCVAYLLGGTGMATLILLIFTVALTPNKGIFIKTLIADPSDYHFYLYFGLSTGVTVLAIFGFAMLMLLPITEEILCNSEEAEIEESFPSFPSGHLTVTETISTIWKESFVIFQVSFTVVALSSLVTMVPPSHFSPTTFPVILLYVTSIAYYLGNEMGVWIPITSNILFVASLIRLFVIIPIIFYMAQTSWLNDYVFIAFVSIYAALGSYFTSKGYQLSSDAVPKSATTRVSNIVNLCLYLGVFVGLSTPFWLRKSYFSFL